VDIVPDMLEVSPLEGRSQLCIIMRDIFGPLLFRPVTLDPGILLWNDRAVQQLAQVIYAERHFEDMPILADALEDAGCTDAELLGHLRGPGPHARGCWVVDLLTGRT
jgi:hypothetical protein